MADAGGMHLEGEGRLRRRVAAAAAATGDLRPVWGDLDKRITRREKEQFETEGTLAPTPGQGQWVPLDPGYLEAKQRARGQRTNIMQRFGELMKSLVNPFDPGAVHRLNRLSYERGTRLAYAAVHQTGSEDGRLPARPPLVWTDEDVDWVMDRLASHIRGDWGLGSGAVF